MIRKAPFHIPVSLSYPPLLFSLVITLACYGVAGYLLKSDQLNIWIILTSVALLGVALLWRPLPSTRILLVFIGVWMGLTSFLQPLLAHYGPPATPIMIVSVLAGVAIALDQRNWLPDLPLPAAIAGLAWGTGLGILISPEMQPAIYGGGLICSWLLLSPLSMPPRESHLLRLAVGSVVWASLLVIWTILLL
jgi:hypothetical protein